MKFLMIGVNVIFWAVGGALLGIGIWLAVDPEAFDSMDASGMDDAMWAAVVYTMIGVGAGVFLIGFLGCCGAWKKRSIMLKLYIGLVSVIMIAEIVIIILTAIFWTSIDDTVKNDMRNDVQIKYKGPDENEDGISQSWNKMQYKWKCCGSYNFTDYKGSDYTDKNPYPVPWTCCVFKDDSDYDNRESVENEIECMKEAAGYNYPNTLGYKYLNARGCYNELSSFFDQNAAIIIGVTCGVIGLQILGIIFACCIMNDDD